MSAEITAFSDVDYARARVQELCRLHHGERATILLACNQLAEVDLRFRAGCALAGLELAIEASVAIKN